MSRLGLSEREWSRSLVSALRRWWYLPLSLAVLGGLLGYLVTSSSPSTATSQVGVQLVSTGGDSTLVDQVVASAMQRLDQRSVYEQAAKQRGTSATDLMARTTVAQVGTSTILEIKVTDPSASKAAADANAVAQAGVAASQQSLSESLKSLSDQSDQLLKNGQLSNQAVESARVTSVAQQLGTSQSDLVARYGTLDVVAPASAADVSKPSGSSIGLMGAAGGLLLGLALAMLLGAKRGRARSVAEVRNQAPHAQVVDAARRAALMRVEAAYHRILVLAPMKRDEAHAALVQNVLHDLKASGYNLAKGQLGMLHSGAPQGQDVLYVVEEEASPELIHLATGNPDAICLVLSKLGSDLLQDVAAIDEKARSEYHLAVEP